MRPISSECVYFIMEGFFFDVEKGAGILCFLLCNRLMSSKKVGTCCSCCSCCFPSGILRNYEMKGMEGEEMKEGRKGFRCVLTLPTNQMTQTVDSDTEQASWLVWNRERTAVFLWVSFQFFDTWTHHFFGVFYVSCDRGYVQSKRMGLQLRHSFSPCWINHMSFFDEFC